MFDLAVRRLVIWVPNWPQAAALVGRSTETPVAVMRGRGVFVCNALARQSGVARGMTRIQARYRCPGLQFAVTDEAREQSVFEGVAQLVERMVGEVRVLQPGLAWASLATCWSGEPSEHREVASQRVFSIISVKGREEHREVALAPKKSAVVSEEKEGQGQDKPVNSGSPGDMVLEEEELVETLGRQLRDFLGVKVWIGIASSPVGALLAARQNRIVPPAKTAIFLEKQLLSALVEAVPAAWQTLLRLAAAHLQHLGVHTLGEVRQLGKAFLVEQCGASGDFLWQLVSNGGQVLGDSPLPSRPLLKASRDLEMLVSRIGELEQITPAIRQLSQAFIVALAGRALTCTDNSAPSHQALAVELAGQLPADSFCSSQPNSLLVATVRVSLEDTAGRLRHRVWAGVNLGNPVHCSQILIRQIRAWLETPATPRQEQWGEGTGLRRIRLELLDTPHRIGVSRYEVCAGSGSLRMYTILRVLLEALTVILLVLRKSR